MNREPDFDETMSNWLDDGADRAPQRFVWAALDDVERTAQRRAWQASVEEFFMRFKAATPILGIAAVVVLSIIAYQLATDSSNIGIVEPPLRTYTAEDLASIVVMESNAPDGMTVEVGASGHAALTTPLRPGGAIIDDTGFVDALITNVGHTTTGGYTSWSALFETSDQAEQAYDFLVTEHESDEGWALPRSSPDLSLGDESVLYNGPAYGWETSGIYLWRVNNLLLAAVGVGDFEPDRLRSIAQEMNARAN